MTDLEYYTSLVTYGCEGCAAYEYLGHCGTWGSDCPIPQFHEFLREMVWTEGYFLSLIEFEDVILPELVQEEDEYLESLAIDIDYEAQLLDDLHYLPDEYPPFYYY